MRPFLMSLSLVCLVVLAQLSMVGYSNLVGSDYPVEILSVKTGVHVNGEWCSRLFFSHLEPMEAVMTLEVRDPSITQVYLTFTVMDSQQCPILFESYPLTVPESGICIVPAYLGLVPRYAALGNATLYSNVLTRSPSQGGRPLCPQDQQSLTIWWNAADVNRDYSVTFLDVVLVCASYGQTDSDPSWNECCDVAIPYRSIDIFDILKVMNSYSEHWCQ